MVRKLNVIKVNVPHHSWLKHARTDAHTHKVAKYKFGDCEGYLMN